MRDVLVTFLILVTIPYIFQRPYVGILVWSWIGYMNPHRLTWGFAYSLPFAQIIAIATLLSVFLSKEKKTIPITPVVITLIVFILIMILSTIFAVYPEKALEELIRLFKIQLAVFLTLMLFDSKEKIHQLLWVIFLSIGFYGVKGGIFVLATGGSSKVLGPPSSFISGNNEIGLAMLVIIPIGFYLMTMLENKWYKRLMMIAVLLCFISVISTYSRGAFVGLVAMLLFFWWKSKRKIIYAITIGLVLILGLTFMPGEYISRLETIQTYEEDGSAMGRVNAWVVAINIAKDRIFGGGFGLWTAETFDLYAPIPEDVHDSHSIYFEVLGELGFLGLFVFLLLHFLAWRDSTWIIKTTENNTELIWANNLAKLLQVTFVAYYVGGVFQGLAFWDLPYHLISIIVLLKIIVLKELDKSDEILNSKKWPWEKS